MTLFRIRGVPIRLHASWLVVVALITWTLSVGYFPVAVPGLAAADYWMYGLAATLLLFVSVFLHELSHTLVALAFGIPVSSITLHVFGGLSQMEREPDRPVAEVLIAAVGPITSFALAGLLLGLIALLNPAASVTATLEYLAAVNALIALFNLTPGFPLDGGRLLRAALWRYRGDIESATRTATRAGAVVAFVLVGLGSVYLVGGEFLAGMWLILIGVFLYHAGQSSYREALVAWALDPFTVADVMPTPEGKEGVDLMAWHIRIRDMMRPDPITMSPQASILEAAQRMRDAGIGNVIVAHGGQLSGIVTDRDIVVRGIATGRDPRSTSLAEICSREVTTVSADDHVGTAIQLMRDKAVRRLPVVQDRRPVGILCLGDLAIALDRRSALAAISTAPANQ